MNEMDLLTRMREEIPGGLIPDRAQDALLTAISAQRSRRDSAARRQAGRGPGRRARAGASAGLTAARGGQAEWTRTRRLVIAGGLSLALAAGAGAVAMISLAGSRPGTNASQAAAGRPHAAAPGTNASQAAAARAHAGVVLVADRAAAALRAQPGFPPGQWVYFKEQDVTPGVPASVDEGWETANGKLMATMERGRLQVRNIVGKINAIDQQDGLAALSSITYQSLSSLPSQPAALARYFENLFSSAPAAQRPEKAFEAIGQLLTVYVTQPSFTAELYRAIAAIPGVSADTHGTDLAGRPAIVLSYLTPTKLLGSEIFLDPHTYWYVGTASSFTNPTKPQIHGLAGYAILRYALVAKPGVQP